jgi:Uma2 family endonuclease
MQAPEKALEKTTYTPEEYLELEVASDERHHYIDGKIILMPGGTPNHNKITLNLASELNFALKRKPYQVFVTDLRVWIREKRIYTYPDVMVVSGELEFAQGRKDTITNPMLVTEVLSKSTRSFDKDEKFAAYRTIPTFKEYILIEQYTFSVEQYYQTSENEWIFKEYKNESDILILHTVDFQIKLADLYDEVSF